MLEKFMESYKLLIIIPVIITIISLGLVAFNGLNEGIDLKGGSLAVLDMNQPTASSSLEAQLKNSLNEQGLGIEEVDVLSNKGTDISVQIGSEVNSTAFNEALNGTGTVTSYNAIGPILSEEAMTQVYWAMAFAFLFMSITVFIIFREPVPSIAVILAAASDIIISMGGMSLFNIPLSIASVGALLMLIGYSVDTDILLTTRLLKRKEGTVVERAREAMKTGMTMSISAIASMVVLYLVTILLIPEAVTLSNIAAVLIIGLVADILTTWLMNLGILRWHMEARR
ncbi:Protein translocase subunit SecF [bioreactor metagenome]|uniref:Protein translocase subunit SecF n=1 Tax=bioreactor metagenome TaxID=1076179 RepID=A0A644X130_9ZZZZ|nr:protein translocase subunit SecF [Methanobrevibacter sp.]MEA4957964.1 protein translocase subunit SecF [Methanobrevibacter sp.]